MIPGIVAQEVVTGGLIVNPGGVRFDNAVANSYLEVLSCTEADTPNLTISMWVRFPTTADVHGALFATWSNGNSKLAVGANHYADLLGIAHGASSSLNVGTLEGVMTAAMWHHVFFSCQTSFGAGAKVHNLYIDGVSVYSAADSADAGASFNIQFNGQSFDLPVHNGNTGKTDYADVWIAPGVYLDATNITKFRSTAGNPVGLGSNGQTPTGSSPAFYFTSPATNFIFNHGSGDAVTLHGNCIDVDGPPTQYRAHGVRFKNS